MSHVNVKYAYYDLGEQRDGTAVRVRLRGSAPNVILLDDENFSRYRVGDPFRYVGGHCEQSPVELSIPRAGRWFLVVDLGGHPGRVQVVALDVLAPDAERAERAEKDRRRAPRRSARRAGASEGSRTRQRGGTAGRARRQGRRAHIAGARRSS